MLLLNYIGKWGKNNVNCISIHLMLLLNLYLAFIYIRLLNYFNTSYVVIKRQMPAKSTIWRRNFNTSYVVIKPARHRLYVLLMNISIHLMLLLNDSKLPWHSKDRLISIHLMLLLNFQQLHCWHAFYLFQYILCCY